MLPIEVIFKNPRQGRVAGWLVECREAARAGPPVYGEKNSNVSGIIFCYPRIGSEKLSFTVPVNGTLNALIMT